MTIQIPVIKRSPSITILKAWLLAGTLDILSAFTHYYLKTGKHPFNVLNFVAGGIFGKEAFTGGAIMQLTGLGLHYLFALLWTLVFFKTGPEILRTVKSTVVAGLLYGMLVWVFMNFVVVPASALPAAPFNFTNAMVAMLIIMFAVGLPIAIIEGKYFRERN